MGVVFALNPRIFLSANCLIIPISENLAPRKYGNGNMEISHYTVFINHSEKMPILLTFCLLLKHARDNSVCNEPARTGPPKNAIRNIEEWNTPSRKLIFSCEQEGVEGWPYIHLHKVTLAMGLE